MNEDNEDGGSAFPVTDSCTLTGSSSGMSMRDYFAAQVVGHLAALERNSTFLNDARDAYCYADAMLAARKESA